MSPRPSSPLDVRFGSKADMCSALGDVRFVPEADIHITNTKTASWWPFTNLDGNYVGADVTQASAREAAKRVLANYEMAGRCWRVKDGVAWSSCRISCEILAGGRSCSSLKEP